MHPQQQQTLHHLETDQDSLKVVEVVQAGNQVVEEVAPTGQGEVFQNWSQMIALTGHLEIVQAGKVVMIDSLGLGLGLVVQHQVVGQLERKMPHTPFKILLLLK